MLEDIRDITEGASVPSDAERAWTRRPSSRASRLRVLVILGHPRGAHSLCGALARAYVAGAREAGAVVELLDLSALDFEPDVRTADPRDQPLEPGLAQAKAKLEAANHIALVFPTWWGTYPARLKGFLDRVLLPGHAFVETEGGTGYEGLLRGRTADIVATMDTPPLVYRLIYRRPGLNAMARATLGFCGFDVARSTVFGPVKRADAAAKARWLAEATRLGRRLERGALSRWQHGMRGCASWLKALRLQFYPMAGLGFALGALGATAGAGVQPARFALGLVCLIALEAATVFGNEICDFETDRRNGNYSSFTGGARVLVDGRLGARAMGWAVIAAFAVSLLSMLALLAVGGLASWPLVPVYAILAVLALGYTLPPLRLCYRGLGELDVALTHSLGVVLFGYLSQGGRADAAFPYLASLPVLVAVLPSIILAGIPDAPADREVGKGTLAVRLGHRRALRLAAAIALLCPAAVFGLMWRAPFDDLYRALLPVAALHGGALAWLLYRRANAMDAPRRIDGPLAASLLYVIWPVLIPLIAPTL